MNCLMSHTLKVENRHYCIVAAIVLTLQVESRSHAIWRMIVPEMVFSMFSSREIF
jgi:hypothetical protein